MTASWIRPLFGLCGLYDFIIGLVFLFAGPQLFDWAGVPHPNHWGYIQFGALLVAIFGLMFFAVAKDPVGNSNLIPFGILLKFSYTGLVGYYWLTTGVPGLFKPFVVIDGLMLLAFIAAYQARPVAAR